MMRLAAAILLALMVGLPLAVWPSAPVTWLAVAALVVGGVGVIALSVPLVTAGATLTLIAYTLALVITKPAVDLVAAIGLGAASVVLLALVHFAGRVHGAALGPAVLVSQVRQWLAIVALGVGAAVVLTVGGAALGHLLLGAALPVIVVTGALGALMAVAGVLALVATNEDA